MYTSCDLVIFVCVSLQIEDVGHCLYEGSPSQSEHRTSHSEGGYPHQGRVYTTQETGKTNKSYVLHFGGVVGWRKGKITFGSILYTAMSLLGASVCRITCQPVGV